jgi:hypothetical protein
MSIDGAVYPGFTPPPPGVIPNLDSPPDAGRRVNIAVLIVCDALATLLYSIRVYVKVNSRSRILLEDGWLGSKLYSIQTCC